MVYDSVTAAALAGLVISDKTKPGITRKYVDLSESSDQKTFRWDYFLPNGKKITNEDRIDFLNKLVVPPAWTEVWFSPQENGHVQACRSRTASSVLQQSQGPIQRRRNTHHCRSLVPWTARSSHWRW